MEKNNIYISNISMEAVMCLILVFLLITCFLQKNRKKTIKALIIMISADFFIMVCQIAEWIFMIEGSSSSADLSSVFYSIKRIMYTVDYFLYYFISVAFYNYIRIHICEINGNSGIYEKKERWTGVLILWGIVISGVFAFLMNTDWFWYLKDAKTEMFDLSSYFTMYLLGTAGTISSAFTLIKNRRVLGSLNFILLTAYIITPYIFVIPDLKNGTCLSYLMISFYTFVLYIHIDLRMEKELTEKEERIILQEKELTELNTQIMLSQMQPHFLYNTLSTISALCYMEGASKAKDVADKFAEYFRENLDAMGREKFVSFEKELSHIKTYLWLEQIRFEDALKVEYDIEVSDFHVPSLSLQPLVENAVKHGIRKKKGGGTVIIKTREFPDEYQVIISDDGAGYKAGTVPDDGRSHTGIKNIKTRLHILCEGVCETESEPEKGTTVTVHIPRKGI